MAVIAMLACYVLLFVTVLTYSAEACPTSAWRVAFVWASVLWGLYLAAITELLSQFTLLTGQWVFALWVALWAALLINLLRLARRGRRLWDRFSLRTPPAWLGLLLVGIVAIATVALLVAIIAPPNTPDSLTYHLARVMHWIQDATLAPYPSNVVAQDADPPWAEYVFLHLHLLTGSDLLDGTVQWFSFVGCVTGVSLIAQQLGARSLGQILAAVFASTIPMAIVQASSTQNDLVAAYWAVCAVYFLIGYARSSFFLAAIGAGASLGLAALTKGSAYTFLCPFLIVFGLAAIRKWRLRTVRPLLSIGVIALVLNLPFFVRNAVWSGHPLGPAPYTSAFSNASFTPDILLLNGVRNLAVQFSTSDAQINIALTDRVDRFLQFFHLDPNDPRATLKNSPPFALRGQQGGWLGDGYTPNPLHLLLALVAIALVLVVGSLRRQNGLLSYLAALVGAFALFSLYLRWGAGSGRLMLGIFVLAAPLVGSVMEALCEAAHKPSRKTKLHVVLAVNTLLMVASSPWVFASQLRPLLGTSSVLTTPRLDQYFAAAPPGEGSYVAAARYITSQGCMQVGYYASGPQDQAGYRSGAPAWEYPLWVLLDGAGGGAVRIEHVNVTNPTARLAAAGPFASFEPCALFALVEPGALGDEVLINNHWYSRAWSGAAFTNAAIAVYVPERP